MEVVKALLVFGSIATVHGVVVEVQVVIHHILSIMSFVIAPHAIFILSMDLLAGRPLHAILHLLHSILHHFLPILISSLLFLILLPDALANIDGLARLQSTLALLLLLIESVRWSEEHPSLVLSSIIK